MSVRSRTAALAVCLGASLAGCLCGCRNERTSEPAPAASAPASPDRLGPGESLPEAETAFGMALPASMRLVRHFDDAAYFSGDIELEALLEHVKQQVHAGAVEMLSQGVLFPRAYVLADDSKRLLRIELSKTRHGTQLHVKDITPPPALSGLSEAEIWRRAGRNLDGTMVDPNQVY
jgi:hypothetical protein